MRVYILDDEPVIRAGLRQKLSLDPDILNDGESGSARDAFRDIETLHLDVVVMDLVLPGMDGVAATREVKRRVPKAGVVVFSVYDRARDLYEVMGGRRVGVRRQDGPAGRATRGDPRRRGGRAVRLSRARRVGRRSRRGRADQPTGWAVRARAGDLPAHRRGAEHRRDGARVLHLAQDGRDACLSRLPQARLSCQRLAISCASLPARNAACGALRAPTVEGGPSRRKRSKRAAEAGWQSAICCRDLRRDLRQDLRRGRRRTPSTSWGGCARRRARRAPG